jgi:hypothetical protein
MLLLSIPRQLQKLKSSVGKMKWRLYTRYGSLVGRRLRSVRNYAD